MRMNQPKQSSPPSENDDAGPPIDAGRIGGGASVVFVGDPAQVSGPRQSNNFTNFGANSTLWLKNRKYLLGALDIFDNRN
jgi:hypothetical protein